MDLVPTLLRNVEAFDGLDLTEHITSGRPVATRTSFWAYKDQLAARREQWKLLIKPNEGLGLPTLPGGPMLFDVVNDPSEKNDVASSQPAIVQRLTEELAAWQARGHNARKAVR
jgi:arylsulfatase A-like enzyme